MRVNEFRSYWKMKMRTVYAINVEQIVRTHLIRLNLRTIEISRNRTNISYIVILGEGVGDFVSYIYRSVVL